MKVLKKKVWPEFFQKILDGNKTFEIRLADEEYNEGDIIVLEEWNPETKEYTGRKIEKKIGFLANIKRMDEFHTKEEADKFGFVVFSLIEND